MSTKIYCASMIRYDLKEVRVKCVVLIGTIVVLTLKSRSSYINVLAVRLCFYNINYILKNQLRMVVYNEYEEMYFSFSFDLQVSIPNDKGSVSNAEKNVYTHDYNEKLSSMLVVFAIMSFICIPHSGFCNFMGIKCKEMFATWSFIELLSWKM